MKEFMTAAAAGLVFAAAAFALPADLVVMSDREVRPDEASGFYYLGQGGGGYLYNGSSAAVGRVAPYRILDRDAQMKDYYIVWAPEWVGVTAEAFAHVGTAVRLSEYEILVGLERGFGPGELRAVEHRNRAYQTRAGDAGRLAVRRRGAAGEEGLAYRGRD
jgi:hypothetical protein